MRRVFTAALTVPLLAHTSLLAQTSDTTGDVVDTEYQDTPLPFGQSSKRQAPGYGRLITNDIIGDGQDRWRTGSVTMSRAWGYRWDGRHRRK